ncbi:hypothetical protein A6P08_10060 [Acidithiobacillus thiooxidans]|nr:hypothetical protein A6P08_10060 [Acidithiobacillus thiooxidans]
MDKGPLHAEMMKKSSWRWWCPWWWRRQGRHTSWQGRWRCWVVLVVQLRIVVPKQVLVIEWLTKVGLLILGDVISRICIRTIGLNRAAGKGYHADNKAHK